MTQLFILAVFILNFKVFEFGYRKTKYVKTSEHNSIAWAKSEYQDATSYLNATLECTTENGDAMVSLHDLKREIRSYGIFSIKEEKIEYIGSNEDKSFVLFDASAGSGQADHGTKGLLNPDANVSGLDNMPAVEKSGLEKHKSSRRSKDQGALSERMDSRLRQSQRTRSKSPSRKQ